MEKKTSVSFDSDIHISFSKRVSSKVYVPHVIAMVLAVMGCMITIQKTLDMPIACISSIAMIGFPCLFTTLYRKKKNSGLFIIGLSILFGLVLYSFKDVIKDALYLLNANFLFDVNKYYFYNFSYFKPALSNSEHIVVATVFMVSVAFILSAIFGLIIVRYKKPLFVLVVFAPFVYLAMNFTDVPLYFPLALLLLSFMATYTMCYSMSQKRAESRKGDFIKLKSKKTIYSLSNKEIKGKTLLSSVVTIIVIILISCMTLSILVPRKSYVPNKNTKIYLKSIIDKINDGSIFNFKTDTASGGLGNGVIGEVDQIQYNNKLHIKVKTDEKVPMYLKGYVGSVYENNKWHDLNDNIIQENKDMFEQFKQAGYSTQMVGIPYQKFMKDSSANGDLIIQNNMTIQNVGPQSEILLLPYYFYKAPYIMANNNYLSDGQIIRTSNFDKPYQVSAYLHRKEEDTDLKQYTPFSSDLPKVSESSQDEYNKLGNERDIKLQNRYQDFVYANYTKLPTSSNQSFNSIIDTFNSLWAQYSNLNTVDQAVNVVKQYMFEHADYSLGPGKTPADKDFIDYFLFENRKGYCVHFATTATVMLRARGIPARYVEGYVITQKDYDEAQKNNIDTIQIRDTNAHAWVEIYEPNIGWVPYEVTPGYSKSQIAERNFTDLPNPPPSQEIEGSVETTSSNITSSEEVSSEISSQPASSQVSSDVTSNLNSDIYSREAATTSSSSELNSSSEVQVGTQNKYSKQASIGMIYFAIILIMIIFTVIARRVFILSKRKSAISNKNANKSVIASYEYILKILEYNGFNTKEYENLESFANDVERKCRLIYFSKLQEVENIAVEPSERLQKLIFFERQNEHSHNKPKDEVKNNVIRKGEFKQVTDIAQKARFSQHSLTLEEKQKVQVFAEKLKDEQYNRLSYLKKFYFKWIKALK